MHITQQEARHLVNLITHYMQLNPEGYLEVTVDLITNTETNTKEILARLVEFSTRIN